MAFQVWDDPQILKSQFVVDDQTGKPISSTAVALFCREWNGVVRLIKLIHGGMVTLTKTEYDQMPCLFVEAMVVHQEHLRKAKPSVKS